MTVERRTVDGLAEPPGYAHVAVAVGSTLVFTAGAVPLDEHGELVGPDDPEMQTDQVVANLLWQLEAGGAGPDDVVKTTVYVAGGSHETQVRVWEAVQRLAAGIGAVHPPRRCPARLPRPVGRDRGRRRHRLTSHRCSSQVPGG